MGQPGGGVCQIQPGGGGTLPGLARGGGTLPGPARGGTLAGGYPGWGGTLAGGVPYPGQGVLAGGGGTQLGQHREYLQHGGRYASCVHAGGLSCLITKMCLECICIDFGTFIKGHS